MKLAILCCTAAAYFGVVDHNVTATGVALIATVMAWGMSQYERAQALAREVRDLEKRLENSWTITDEDREQFPNLLPRRYY